MTFTVITPSRNQLDWLELCLASVADQVTESGSQARSKTETAATKISVRHIVCDGQSAGIEEFKERMLVKFPERANYRLEFFIAPDSGMYDAINQGLRRAEGDVCSYLNCDEQLLPGALLAVHDFFEHCADIDVVFGDTVVVSRTGEPLCYWRPYVPSLKHLAGATLNTLSCSTFFRRNVVEEGHLFEPEFKAVGDLIWIRGLLQKRRPMACLPRPLAAFTFLGDNLGSSAKAQEEFEISRKTAASPVRLFRRGLHGLRKLFSGAYVRRKVTYDLFVLSDPSRRHRFHCASLGWVWPALAESR